MKVKRVITLLLVALMLFPVVLLEAQAAPLNPHGRWINGARPNFIVHRDFGAQTMTDFNSALWVWNNQLGFTKITRNPTVRHTRARIARPDGTNSVYRQNAGVHGPIAMAESFYLGTTGGHQRIIEVDITFNMSHSFHNNPSATSPSFDVWSIMAHEGGHALGLVDHSIARSAIMFWRFDPAERRRHPTALDTMHLNVLNYRP
jgi:hypothetical protein